MDKTEKEVLVANGKLLITGEYLVMEGATAMALPLSLGQTLSYEPSGNGMVHWRATDTNGTWFEGEYSLTGFDLITSSDNKIGKNLQLILREAAHLNPDHPVTQGLNISTHLNFNRLLGLGSSSTLIALIAELFNVDKYKLHRRVSSGSGYDMACTGADHPIFYTRISEEEAIIEHLNYNPPFSDKLYFAYLGNKQDTNSEINNYYRHTKVDIKNQLRAITEITRQLPEVQDFTTFTSLMERHEEIISAILNRDSLKKSKFSDFNGCIKSLGAWGGDFVLAGSAMTESDVLNYFAGNNITTVYHFKDLVLNNKVIKNHDTIIKF